jgi:pimeloyl-ACP methyl ester carboxylesterase
MISNFFQWLCASVTPISAEKARRIAFDSDFHQNRSEPMKSQINPLRSALAIVAAASLASGCGGSDDPILPPSAPINLSTQGALVSATNISNISSTPQAAEVKQIQYSMRGVDGVNVGATALVFTPKGQKPVSGWPTVVWAHGTTGIADACAPSSSFDQFGDGAVVDALLGAGFAVIAPDYEGIGTPGIHPYYSRTSHGWSVLDAFRAARALPGAPLSKSVAFLGHSQGGNVAIAANEMSTLIASEIDVRAVVALAPGSDLAKTSEKVFELIDTFATAKKIDEAAFALFNLNVNGAYVAYGFQAQTKNAFDPKTLFGDRMAKLLPTALTDKNCQEFSNVVVQDITSYLRAGGSIGIYPGIQRNWASNATVAPLLGQNAIGQIKTTTPTIIIQGTQDWIVPPAVTEALVASMQKAGNSVQLIPVEGADHNEIVKLALPDVVTYFKTRF